MTINSLYFLLVFLPVVLLLYYVLPKSLKHPLLVAASFLFYAWGSPVTLLLLLLSLAFNYVGGLELDRLAGTGRDGLRKLVLITGIVANVLVLAAYKYTGFFLANLRAITGLKLLFSSKTSPLGLSFYTFTILSYLIDVYRGAAPALKNPMDLALYAAFFPKMASGPIVKYDTFHTQLQDHPVSAEKTFQGVKLMLIGLFKKVLIADRLGIAFNALIGMEALSAVSAWLAMLCFSIQLYFDFSGYSDMAIGLSAMFGFTLPENFNHPYHSVNVTDFWRRWHISLGSWFRNYIYIPLGGNRRSTPRVIFNYSVVWLLTGFWHGASWSFIAWGLYHGLFVVLDRYVLNKPMEHVPHKLRVLLTFLTVILGWPLFFSSSLTEALHFYGMLFGSGHLGFLDATARYYISGYWLPLLISIIGLGPLPMTIHDNLLYRAGSKRLWVSAAITLALLLVCIAALLSATYTSFLYVQF